MALENVLRALAHEFKTRRLELGMSQDDLAEEGKCTRVQISKLENAKGNLTLRTLIRLCSALKLRLVLTKHK